MECQKDGVPVWFFKTSPTSSLEALVLLQCIGSRSCLECIEVRESCSYGFSPSSADGCEGKPPSQLEESLEEFKDDGSVPSGWRIAFTLL